MAPKKSVPASSICCYLCSKSLGSVDEISTHLIRYRVLGELTLPLKRGQHTITVKVLSANCAIYCII